jgi:3',5'-cyclic AMP phosphodiesterase CpdA
MRKIRLFTGMLLVVLTACNSPSGTKALTGEDEFSFAFLTDIHLQPERGAEAAFQWVINDVNKRNPDFVLTGGDMIMDALNQTYGRVDSLYNSYERLAGKFKMPVYNTIGNHEVYGWQRNEANIEQHPEFGKNMYEQRVGPRYYTFEHKGWHFLVLDAISLGERGVYTGGIDQEQLAWIAGELQNIEKDAPIAISVHMPFVTSATQLTRGALAPNPEGLVIGNSSQVLRLFTGYNLKLVLQGHLHYLEDIYVQNQTHFITGGAVCGRWWNNEPDSKPEEGFVMVHVKGDELTWEYVDYGWTPPEDI